MRVVVGGRGRLQPFSGSESRPFFGISELEFIEGRIDSTEVTLMDGLASLCCGKTDRKNLLMDERHPSVSRLRDSLGVDCFLTMLSFC